MPIDAAITTTAAIAIAMLFAASAARKVADFAEFAGVVRNYAIAPAALSAPLGGLLIAIEASIAALLLAPATRAAAGVAAAALFCIYAMAIGLNLARGRTSIDCGCSFGASGDRLSPTLLYRNGLLAATALVAAAPASSRALSLADFAFVALFSLTAAAAYLAAETLRSTASRVQMERSR